MNIRPSVKLYFIVATILLVLVITVTFSVLSLEYFSRGIDVGSLPIMEKIADVEGVEDESPVEVLHFHVTSRWQDLPQHIRLVFDDIPIAKPFHINKKLIGDSFISPPKSIYLVAKFINSAGEVRFVATKNVPPENYKSSGIHIPPGVKVVMLCVASLGLFFGGLLFIIRKVATPVERLKTWAKSLDEKTIQQPIPDFQYSELNTLARIVNSSLNSTQESLSREQKFLAHASHELRTPLSVIRVNTDLLTKLQQKEGVSSKQAAVVSRIVRAGKTMTDLTNTLLWLGRDDANLPASESVDLQAMVEELVIELRYLIENKPVELIIETESFSVQLAQIPCRIVLANLIRNAFQHTLGGKIIIKQSAGMVSIENSCDIDSIDSSELGFGLGLRLTRELSERYRWQYSDKIEPKIYQASITFAPL